jgi:hypothetical protein
MQVPAEGRAIVRAIHSVRRRVNWGSPGRRLVHRSLACASVQRDTPKLASSDRMVVPEELDGANVLKYAIAADEVEPTGATRHEAAGRELRPAAALAIAKYEGREGFYLFYLDNDGAMATDTFHDSVEDALGQAAFEYTGLRWSDVA